MPRAAAAGGGGAVEFTVTRQTVPIHEQVYRLLRQAIIEGRMRPGEPLVESRLAARLRVSRAPVREALRKLERDGLVVARLGRGLRVAWLSLQEIGELYACRAALERLAAQQAAERVASGSAEGVRALQMLEAALAEERQRVAASASVEDLVEATNRFHHAVVEASGNGCLAELMGRLQDRIVQARRTSLSVPGNPRRFHQHHGQVLEAIRAGQAERAGRLMEQHVLDARARLLAFLSRTLPEGGDGAAGDGQTMPAEGRGGVGGFSGVQQGSAGP